MEKVKILAIAPYEGMAEMMRKLAERRKDIELTVEIGNFYTARQIIQRKNEYEFDVIVSRGGTATALRSFASVPVVEISVSVFDMLRCLKSVQGYNGKVAVMGFSNITECAVELSTVMRYNLEVCTITENSDVKTELLKLRKSGVGLVLCDHISKNQAQEIGMNAVLLTSDETGVSAAFDEALHVCRWYGDIQRRNEIMSALLSNQDEQNVFYDENGHILFSSIQKGSLYEGFEQQLDKILPDFLNSDFLERELIWKDKVLLLSSTRPVFHGRKCLIIKVKASEHPLVQDIGEVSISARAEQMLSEIAQIGNAVLMGETGELISICYRTKVPVLIIGETGTGKDTVASLIYRYGPFSERMMVTVDCESSSPRRWKTLLSRESSPFLRTGVTIYFRSVNCMDNSQAEMLFGFIEQTAMHKRNRLIFSCAAGREFSEESYVCSYLKNHFSTIIVRLPPLRQRRGDIPGIAALYINQVNEELGKQFIGFDPGATALLQKFAWDENLTQLNRIIRMLALTAREPYIREDEVKEALKRELPQQAHVVETGYGVINLKQALNDIVYDVIRLVMEEENGNRSRVAQRLGISRSTVWNTLKRDEN